MRLKCACIEDKLSRWGGNVDNNVENEYLIFLNVFEIMYEFINDGSIRDVIFFFFSLLFLFCAVYDNVRNNKKEGFDQGDKRNCD